MRTLLVVVALGLSACGAGARKPCGWYFASERANTTRGPVGWLSGVWKGDRATGDCIWTPFRDGMMTGVWRRGDEVRFYSLRQVDATITLVELAPDATSTTYEAVERGERAIVFASGQQRLAFREVDSRLEWTVERADAPVERRRLSLEI